MPDLDLADVRKLVVAFRRAVADQLSKVSTHSPAEERAAASRITYQVLDAWSKNNRVPMDADTLAWLHDQVINELFGLGRLQALVDDPEIENIQISGWDTVFVIRGGGEKLRVAPVCDTDEELIQLVYRAAATMSNTPRLFDSAHPLVSFRLPDGSRMSATMDICERPDVSIRRHSFADADLESLVQRGTLSPKLAEMLDAAVRARLNILIGGSMNAGKTTLLRALAACIPSRERIVTIESALELELAKQTDPEGRPRHPDVLAMETRDANAEGYGAVDMPTLVAHSLRKNADRVILGEILGGEVINMLNVMTQGVSGSMGTIHADSSANVFTKIANYAAQSAERLGLEASALAVAAALHLVVYVHFDPLTNRRVVNSVREVTGVNGMQVVSNEIWRPGPAGDAIPGAPMSDELRTKLARYGYVTPTEEVWQRDAI
ncbi:MAG: ATPase, T2SS/T4P/T4SS family [Actinomycetota bacterium]|nr:ATPase, T2SS/T4P/T4SS family [Actinomycetota bacterium]